LRLRRGEGEGQFVVHPAHGVADHLIFVDHEKARAEPLKKFAFLGFERRDQDLCFRAQGEVSRGDAHIPTARLPFGQFVVRQSASGHREDGLATQRWQEKFEDIGLAGARGRVDDDIPAISQSSYGFLLPQVWNDEVLNQGIEGGGYW
jgi:hypothetical protein